MGMVPGYLASVVVDSTELSGFTSSATFDTTRDAIDKTKLGQSRRTYDSGLGDASLSASIHADSTLAAALESAYQAVTPVSYVFRAGELGVVDLGSYTGVAIVTDRSYVGDADSEWNYSLELQCSGDYVYTAPTA